jgi:predicted phosphoribosyltransferase
MRVGVEALHKASAGRIIVAVPTGHNRSAQRLAGEVEVLHCANIRSGSSFAVADAYERWTDVSEEEVRVLLASAAEEQKPSDL